MEEKFQKKVKNVDEDEVKKAGIGFKISVGDGIKKRQTQTSKGGGRGGGWKVGEDEIKPKGTKGGVSLVARKKRVTRGGERRRVRKTKTTTERGREKTRRKKKQEEVESGFMWLIKKRS